MKAVNKKYSYVYQIMNLITLKKYIGSRSCDIDPIYDIGVVYFSSSSDTDFIKDQKENRQNYNYQILAVFDNPYDALRHEALVHDYFNVHIRNDYYNRSKQISTGFSTSGMKFEGKKGADNPLFGVKRPKHSKLMKGKRNPFYGKHHSEETLTTLSKQAKRKVVAKNTLTGEMVRVSKDEFDQNPNLVGTTKGVKISPDVIALRSKAIRGKKKPTSVCPHCQKQGANHLMVRYHFDKCKGIKI